MGTERLIIDHVITSVRIYRALNDAVAGYQMKAEMIINSLA